MAIKYIIHGGSFFDSSFNIRCDRVARNSPHNQSPDKGFRMVKNDNFRSSDDSADEITGFRLAKDNPSHHRRVLRGGAWHFID